MIQRRLRTFRQPAAPYILRTEIMFERTRHGGPIARYRHPVAARVFCVVAGGLNQIPERVKHKQGSCRGRQLLPGELADNRICFFERAAGLEFFRHSVKENDPLMAQAIFINQRVKFAISLLQYGLHISSLRDFIL
jgi:hypothetical protein